MVKFRSFEQARRAMDEKQGERVPAPDEPSVPIRITWPRYDHDRAFLVLGIRSYTLFYINLIHPCTHHNHTHNPFSQQQTDPLAGAPVVYAGHARGEGQAPLICCTAVVVGLWRDAWTVPMW